MSDKVTINKQAILKAYEEEGMKKHEIRKTMYPGITIKNWEKVWDALGLKNTRPKKAFKFEIEEGIVDDSPLDEVSGERFNSRDYPIVEED